jgi:hypothetical protein
MQMQPIIAPRPRPSNRRIPFKHRRVQPDLLQRARSRQSSRPTAHDQNLGSFILRSPTFNPINYPSISFVLRPDHNSYSSCFHQPATGHLQQHGINFNNEINYSQRTAQMKGKSKFSLVRHDEPMEELMRKTDHKTLATWAIDCAERVLPYFQEAFPDDPRPKQALEACQAWIDTGIFKMAVIRHASLSSHAAARDVGEDNPARSAARAAGQAAATPHVFTHSIGAAIYAQQAIHRATPAPDTDAAVAGERDWQYQHLLDLINSRAALTPASQPSNS